MEEHTCKRCGHVSSTKSNYVRHIKRICSAPVEDITQFDLFRKLCEAKRKRGSCPHCDQKFNTRSNLGKHVRGCKRRPEVILREDYELLANKVRECEINNNSATTTNNTNNGTINNIVKKKANIYERIDNVFLYLSSRCALCSQLCSSPLLCCYVIYRLSPRT